jgi:hypothetical protein
MPTPKLGENHNKTTTDKLIRIFIQRPQRPKVGNAKLTSQVTKMNDTDTGHIGWPYTERSCLIAPDIARSIRAWALKEMTEAHLNSYSQRQLMEMHLKRARDILAKVRPERNDPDVQAWSQAKAEEMFADMKRRGSDVPYLMGALNAH